MAKKKKDGSSHLATIITAAVTVVIGIVLLAYFTDLNIKKPASTAKSKPPRSAPAKKTTAKKIKIKSREITIYLSDPDGGYLKAERRRIKDGPLGANIEEAIKRLIADGRAETIPAGTELINLDIEGDTLYADFSGALKANHPGGSTAEINTVYAIVNTVTLNFAEIESVQILVEGEELATLAGHIDISRPIGAEKRVINP
jgi:spore germination protein GerM